MTKAELEQMVADLTGQLHERNQELVKARQQHADSQRYLREALDDANRWKALSSHVLSSIAGHDVDIESAWPATRER